MRWAFVWTIACLPAAATLGAEDRPDLLVADFEGETYGDWKVEGEAFGSGPARGTLPNQMAVTGYLGKGLVNSFRGGDGATGTLTSPSIRLERKYIRFLIGGGKFPGKTCINLLVNGKVVRTATGPNDQPGGSEALDWAQWDVAEFEGTSASIQVVDQATGGWGHINVDHILQTDRKLPGVVADARRELTLDKRYLNLPVKNGAKKRRVSLSADGALVDDFEIELADGKPDFWAFIDVSRQRGAKAVLKVDRLPEESAALKTVELSDAITGSEDLYREKLRPQFHFSSRRGWLNDPNGLVYHRGEFHLFYQHNPFGWDWGNMHWGHAVSRDLVHWRELPVALTPRQFGDWCFSGSAVVDRDNTAGFKEGDADVLVAAFTSTGRGECIAYSTDGGRTFAEYEGNPVVKHQGRDPKVIWHGATRRWVMAVYDERGKSQGIAFYASPDLKHWDFQSRIEGWFECPELFELPVDGDRQNTRWVVYAADNHYAIGTFDGKTFAAESGKLPGANGNCLYAAQTYNDVPAADGRRIQVGWARVATPGMPFNQMMTFPVELTLRKTADGIRMFANPVRELESLTRKKHSWADWSVGPGARAVPDVSGDLFRVRAELDPGDSPRFGLNVRGTRVVCDVKKGILSCGNASAPWKAAGKPVRLEVLVDRTSVEVFVDDGRLYLPVGVIHPENDHSLQVFAEGGTARATRLDVHELKSAWE